MRVLHRCVLLRWFVFCCVFVLVLFDYLSSQPVCDVCSCVFMVFVMLSVMMLYVVCCGRRCVCCCWLACVVLYGVFAVLDLVL